MRSISRDPFARHDIVRRTVQVMNGQTCSWCDQVRPQLKLFEYGTERDDRPGERNVGWHKGLFCSKSCHDSYHS